MKELTQCCNPSLGLSTKARACKGVGQEGSPGVTSHVPKSVGECEGMNLHTPKWAPILGVGVLMDSWIFKEHLQGSKPIELSSSLYNWKYLWTMGSHDPFGHLKHKLWPKERLRVKLPIWFPTTKSWESPWFPYMQVACDISLEIFWQLLQLCLKAHLHRRFAHKVMGSQSCGSPNFGNFEIPIWESCDKMTFGCWSRG
jgi:hypothetical protein